MFASLRLQALRPLFDITEALFTETNLERLHELILDAICGHLHCSHAGLYQRKTDEEEFFMVAGRGFPISAQLVNPNEEIFSRADTNSLPVCINSDGVGNSKMQNILTQLGLTSVTLLIFL